MPEGVIESIPSPQDGATGQAVPETPTVDF